MPLRAKAQRKWGHWPHIQGCSCVSPDNRLGIGGLAKSIEDLGGLRLNPCKPEQKPQHAKRKPELGAMSSIAGKKTQKNCFKTKSEIATLEIKAQCSQEQIFKKKPSKHLLQDQGK